MLITLCSLSKCVHNANGNDDLGDDQKSTRFLTIIFLRDQIKSYCCAQTVYAWDRSGLLKGKQVGRRVGEVRNRSCDRSMLEKKLIWEGMFSVKIRRILRYVDDSYMYMHSVHRHVRSNICWVDTLKLIFALF